MNMEVDEKEHPHPVDDVGKKDIQDSSSSLSSTTDSDSASSSSSDESDDDLDGDGNDEDDGDGGEIILPQETLCPVCNQISATQEVCIDHLGSVHQLHILKEFRNKQYDCIDFIKLVNFLRSKKKDTIDVSMVFTDSNVWRKDDSFMKPVLSEDPLLTFDIESLLQESSTNPAAALGSGHGNFEVSANLTRDGYISKIRELTRTIESMRSCMKTVMVEGNSTSNTATLTSRPSAINYQDTSGKDTASAISRVDDAANDVKSKKHKRRRVKRRPSSSDTNQVYFSSYSHFGIHHEMLSDVVRTNSYRNAILDNPSLFRGSRVLDVGCGTGILSMFAATAGASKVIAVDDSDIAFYAMMIVGENKFKQTIDVVKSRLERMPDPKGEEEKYDIIISEWMGYFLVYEGMLDTVITARDRFLKKDTGGHNFSGVLLPNRAVIRLAALSDEDLYKKHVTFWSDVYGYSMSSLRSECITEPLITHVKDSSLCSDPVSVAEIDMMTCTLESTRVLESDVVLKIMNNQEKQEGKKKETTIHAIVGWFDCFFDHQLLGNQSNVLSTSPLTPETHWKQTVFLLKNPLVVSDGGELSFKVTISRPKHEDRALKVDFAFTSSACDHSRQEYVLL